MRVGEKIKTFRDLKNLSQKKLAELSGVSEISIRKYEAGDRNPKSEQLEKIAKALDIGVDILLGVKLNTLSIQTVGDAMALLLLLEERIGISYDYKTDSNKNIVPTTLKLHFNNEKINVLLSQWIDYNEKGKIRAEFINRADYTNEERERMSTLENSLLEVEKQRLMECPDLIDSVE